MNKNLLFDLSKKASASSSRKSSSRSTSKKSSGEQAVVTEVAQDKPQVTAQEVISKAKILQRPGNQGAVYDGISGKTFGSMPELLKYYNV